MPQILKWLEAEPDHNAKELFIRLQEEHPINLEMDNSELSNTESEGLERRKGKNFITVILL